MTAQMVFPDLSELNDSELVLLCQWVGMGASRGWPREVLISTLENFEPVEIDLPYAYEQEILSQFLEKYWKRIRMQVSKKVCPNCSECREMQVLECYGKNRKHLGGRK